MSSVTLPRLSSSLAFDFVTKRTVRFPSRLNKDKVTSGDNERYTVIARYLWNYTTTNLSRYYVTEYRIDRMEDKQKKIPNSRIKVENIALEGSYTSYGYYILLE